MSDSAIEQMRQEARREVFAEACPFSIGDAVTVSPGFRYASEWPGSYTVTGIRWEYQLGDGRGFNIEIATEADICARHGSTDGFSPCDLVLESRKNPRSDADRDAKLLIR